MIECGSFKFTCNFDSGNIANAKLVSPTLYNVIARNPADKTNDVTSLPEYYEFDVWTKQDCAGTQFENGNRSWFYFGVQGPPSAHVKLNIVNLNRQQKLFVNGMQPVYKIVPGKTNWERIKEKPTYIVSDIGSTLSFIIHTPENASATIYIAFTFPYTYKDLQDYLLQLDKKLKDNTQNIYYYRECVCFSLDEHRIDLITVTSEDNICTERETRLPNLFPETAIPRPFCCIKKKVVFISARVHPGETPSSFVLHGFLDFILDPDDVRACVLRKMYVFKIIPMLNPDGVVRGHYRTDTRGVNLNRMYLKPCHFLHPSVYAARALILHHHSVQLTSVISNRVPLTGFFSDFGVKLCDFCGSYFNSSICKCQEKLHDKNSLPDLSKISGEDSDDSVPSPCSTTALFKSESPTKELKKKISNSQRNKKKPKISPLVLKGKKKAKEKPESGLFMYVDLHGHSSKRGIFMYGNHFSDAETLAECMLIPKLLSINCPNFDFNSCNFSRRNMYMKDRQEGLSKEGCGRVAVYTLTNLIRSYTLECNYNTGTNINVIPPASHDQGRASPPPSYTTPPKYTPAIYKEVGRELAISILDVTSSNPWSRIPNSEFHNIPQIRQLLKRSCLYSSSTSASSRQTVSTYISPHTNQPPKVLKNKCKALNKCKGKLKTLDTLESTVARCHSYSDVGEVSNTSTASKENSGVGTFHKIRHKDIFQDNVTYHRNIDSQIRSQSLNSLVSGICMDAANPVCCSTSAGKQVTNVSECKTFEYSSTGHLLKTTNVKDSSVDMGRPRLSKFPEDVPLVMSPCVLVPINKCEKFASVAVGNQPQQKPKVKKVDKPNLKHIDTPNKDTPSCSGFSSIEHKKRKGKKDIPMHMALKCSPSQTLLHATATTRRGYHSQASLQMGYKTRRTLQFGSAASNMKRKLTPCQDSLSAVPFVGSPNAKIIKRKKSIPKQISNK